MSVSEIVDLQTLKCVDHPPRTTEVFIASVVVSVHQTAQACAKCRLQAVVRILDGETGFGRQVEALEHPGIDV